MVGPGGSRIVVTTRSRKVASIMGTVLSYDLKGLSEDDCLAVLLKWAFKEGDYEKYHNLVNIGRDIVRKCGGVPLAARTLGSLLYSIVDEKEWLSVRDTEVWALVQKENDILPVLRLSYDQMPSYLKQCFAYCSLLVKDEVIYKRTKRTLIHHWMAQGFIKLSNPNEELEEKGKSYFNELVRRSFLEGIEDSKIYKMHDLFHDLAQFVAGNECLSLRSKAMTFIPDGVRHVSFHNAPSVRPPEGADTLHDGKKLRTILSYENTLPCSFDVISTSFRCLRVLDLDYCDSVPSSVFKDLKHLRYLKMNWSYNNLPNSLSRLFNLQCLHIQSEALEKLPKGFKNLINLRHLSLSCRKLVLLLEKWIGRLTSLRSFSILFSPMLTSLPECFQRLTNLRKLDISRCEDLVSLLPGMRHLAALEKITIRNCNVLQFADDDFQGLTSLKSLHLYDLPLVESLPMGLQCAAPTLTKLKVAYCDRLTTLSVSLENFTSLKSLEIKNCPNLLCLPEGIQSLTTLQSLYIGGCHHLRRRYSKDVGELWHQISHIPDITIT